MVLSIDSKVKASFPELEVLVSQINNVAIRKVIPKLEEFKKTVIEEARSSYNLEKLKDKPILRAYRDFFWKISVDPTKSRPAAEALIWRIVARKPLPNINTLVDAYNLASVKTEVAIAAFDADQLAGKLISRKL